MNISQKKAFWEAVDRYVLWCGGDPVERGIEPIVKVRKDLEEEVQEIERAAVKLWPAHSNTPTDGKVKDQSPGGWAQQKAENARREAERDRAELEQTQAKARAELIGALERAKDITSFREEGPIAALAELLLKLEGRL
jgi:hypothetical protein